MHLHDRTGVFRDGPFIIGDSGAVCGSHFTKTGAALLHDVRNAETTAYFNQFASGNNHLFVFGKRGKHKCHCGGIVIYDSGMLTADNPGDPC